MRTEHLLITYIVVALCAFGVFFVSGCKKENKSEHQAYAIRLNTQKDTTVVGEVVVLTATVGLSYDSNVMWKSGDENVARVTGVGLKGNVTGMGEGKTYIYCILGEKFSDSCEIVVRLAIYPEAPHLECQKIGNTVWAPVNCGYDTVNYPYGKLYQWGRKNGCGYKAIDETSSYNDRGGLSQITVSGPVIATSENADSFYTSSSENYGEWLTPRNDMRWNSGTESSPVKTQYDPCPTGWRVPTASEWREFRPMLGLLLPVAGCRRFSDGNAVGRGSVSSYWSSLTNDCFAMSISGTTVMSLGPTARAFGLPVRCVQDKFSAK